MRAIVTDDNGAALVEVHRGRQAWFDLAEDVDVLHEQLGTPITARRLWLNTWLECYAQFEPVMVSVRSDGLLVGLTALGRLEKRGVTHYVLMGHGPSDVVEFSAIDDDTHRTLVLGVVEMMGEANRRWTLTARGLMNTSPAIHALLDGTPICEMTSGDVLPRTVFESGRELRAYVSRNHHLQVRRLRNRADRDGLALNVDHLRGDALLDVLDDLIAIQGLRELDAGRRLKTKDSRDGYFLRNVITIHAEHDLVEATVLSANGRPAAFTLTFLDGVVRRLWTLAFDPAYRDYGLGRICVDASLERALQDPSCHEYDFMKGDEAYKHTFANRTDRTVDVLAWSSTSLRILFDSRRRLLNGIKSMADSDPRVRRIVDLGIRARTSWWHRSARRNVTAVGDKISSS